MILEHRYPHACAYEPAYFTYMCKYSCKRVFLFASLAQEQKKRGKCQEANPPCSGSCIVCRLLSQSLISCPCYERVWLAPRGLTIFDNMHTDQLLIRELVVWTGRSQCAGRSLSASKRLSNIQSFEFYSIHKHMKRNRRYAVFFFIKK